jgi:citrate lyase subunit beta / citryl-CoA lyase
MMARSRGLARSLLFAPANRPELLEKFPRFEADAYAIDLEDGTPEADKPRARAALAEVVSQLRRTGLRGSLLVRVNAPGSKHAVADLAAAHAASVDGVIVPKLETPDELAAVADALVNLGAAEGFGLIGLVETVRGVINVERLAGAAVGALEALAFGAEDFVTDIGGRRTADGAEVLYARSRVVLAAKSAGLAALDQVFVGIRDTRGFRKDAELGRALGYTGKMCIAPGQVELANEVFSPSAEEVERSLRLVEAYERAAEEGRGVIEFEGTMIDEPLLKRARAVLALASRAASGTRL